ncbi:hypothetical protein AALB47_24360, partial [Lachnospiraceae bacterium 54-11]
TDYVLNYYHPYGYTSVVFRVVCQTCFYYTTGVVFLYSIHRHLHLLFPQLSWGIDTVSFIIPSYRPFDEISIGKCP